MASALSLASSALAQINIPTNLVVRAPLTTAGGNLRGEYWKRPVYSVPLDGSTNPTNRIDNLNALSYAYIFLEISLIRAFKPKYFSAALRPPRASPRY